MNSTPSTSVIVYEHHKAFSKKSLTTGCSTAAAVFLIVGAIIVIMGACLCLTLPGVNIMTQIVGPAIFPSLLAIAISIPFIIKARRSNKEQKESLKARNEATFELCDQHKISTLNEGHLLTFFKKTLLTQEWFSMKTELNKLLEEIKKKYASEGRFKKIFEDVQKELLKIKT